MTRVYIAAHKAFQKPDMQCYCPLQVGAEGKKDLGYLKDNSGDTISARNANYCELTGLYWIWKNDKSSNIVGLVHYRRYFTRYSFSAKRTGILSESDINHILKQYDMILPKREYLKETAWEEYYMVSGLEKDLERVKNIIRSDCPDYLDAFERYFSQNRSHLYNMMICKKELLDEYCQWLFSILFQLEKMVDYSDYNDYQKRVFGFMSERLLNVWVLHHNLKVKEVRTINTEMKLQERIRIALRRIKNRVIFRMKKKTSK